MIVKDFKQTIAGLSSLFVVIFLLASCGGSGKQDDSASENEKTNLKQSEKDTLVQNIFYSVPSPMETATLIQKTGVPYNKDYLNDVKNISKYTTTGSKALNLGVYGTDLSFTSIYDQTQESILYLKCANNLSSGLGINNAFGEETADRLDLNRNNKDSLLSIISESFWQADSYLKDNERPGTSSLIIVGGWIEAIYIATRIEESSKNPEITTRIAEQKFTLENLVKMLKRNDSDPTVAAVYKDLIDLKTVFDQISVVKSSSSTSKDQNTGITTIGGNNKLNITPAQLKLICEKMELLRTKITK
jgi:hypothetical protein